MRKLPLERDKDGFDILTQILCINFNQERVLYGDNVPALSVWPSYTSALKLFLLFKV